MTDCAGLYIEVISCYYMREGNGLYYTLSPIIVPVWLNPGRQNPDGSKKQPAQAGLYPGGVKIQPGKN